jgi:hypothetical protein
MDRLATRELSELVEHRADQCLSLYMPTHPAGVDAQQDQVRLKNLADKAEKLLVEHGMRAAEARDLIQSLRELPQDPIFWMHRSLGLAAFLSRSLRRVFRLAWPFQEVVTVNRRFHIKQLLPLLADLDYHVLELDLHGPTLYRGNRYRLQRVTVEGMPGEFEQYLVTEERTDSSMQAHSAGRAPGPKKHTAVFHGQGGVRDSAKEELTKYLKQVDVAIMPLLNSDSWPLVLAGVEYVTSIFRSLCRYPHLVQETITGSAGRCNEQELHQKAWSIMERKLADREQALLDRFRQRHGTGKATDNILEIVPAASDGKVDSLIVVPTAQIWGTYDAQAHVATVHTKPQPGDDDLIDLAVVETLKHAGQIVTAPPERMPTASPVAAVFRY